MDQKTEKGEQIDVISSKDVSPGRDRLLQEIIPDVAYQSAKEIVEFHFEDQELNPDLIQEYRTRMEDALKDEFANDAEFLMTSSIGRKPTEIEEALKGFEKGIETAISFENQALSRREADTIIKTGNELLSNDAKEFFLKGLFAANLGPRATDFPRLLKTHASTTSQQVLESLPTKIGIPNAEQKIFNWAQRLAETAKNFALEGEDKAKLIGWTSATSPDNKGPLQQSLQSIHIAPPSL